MLSPSIWKAEIPTDRPGVRQPGQMQHWRSYRFCAMRPTLTGRLSIRAEHLVKAPLLIALHMIEVHGTADRGVTASSCGWHKTALSPEEVGRPVAPPPNGSEAGS